jgi:hypothetical protein
MLSNGGFDAVSQLASTEVPISAATTLTNSAFGKMHKVSGTSADYTITLPAASGNAGKIIGFRVLGASSASKLYTLDGNASETIDGATTRILWAEESALLLCDGSNWFKVAGKTRPMACQVIRNTNQASVSNITVTLIDLNNTDTDNTGAMADLANDRVNVKRAGTYLVTAGVAWNNFPANKLFQTRIHKNGSVLAVVKGSLAVAEYPDWFITLPLTLAAGDYLDLRCYQDTGASQTVYGDASFATGLSLLEAPSW